MRDFLRQNGGLLLVIAALLSLLLGVGSVLFSGSTDPITGLVGTVTAPFRNGTAAALTWAEGVYGYLFHYEEMEGELSDLRRRVAELEEQVRQNQDADWENERLRRLLELQEKHRDFQFVSARIAARSTSNWESTMTIGKGSAAGISVGDCVVTELGQLVGVVSQVSYSTSVVSTLVNTDVEMGGMVSRTYSAGILAGDFTLMTQERLKLSYLTDEAQLVAGDEVITSGMGAAYPSGLVVGRIEGVFTEPSGMTRYALVAPSANLGSLVEVFIIVDFAVTD